MPFALGDAARAHTAAKGPARPDRRRARRAGPRAAPHRPLRSIPVVAADSALAADPRQAGAPARQRASRSRAEAAGRAQPGVEPATAALTWLIHAISVVCCYRLETQTRSRTQRANANSAASVAAETVLAMNQNISKPSTLAGENTAATSPSQCLV